MDDSAGAVNKTYFFDKHTVKEEIASLVSLEHTTKLKYFYEAKMIFL